MFALAGVIMDVMDTLVVRFHFNGMFINSGNSVHYVGGRRAMSYIDRDKVFFQRLLGTYETIWLLMMLPCCTGCSQGRL
jgi:hypothetical protein